MNDGLDSVWQGITAAVSAVGEQQVFGSLALFLALVFIVSAIPKLRRPELAAMAIADFGVADSPPRWTGLALGGVELFLALGLIGSAISGGAVRIVPVALSAILLSVFVVLIAKALRSQESFSCYCFGNSDETISQRTLLRTAALATLAIFLVTGGTGVAVDPPTVTEWILEMTIAASLLGGIALLAQVKSVLEVPHACP